MFPRQLDKRSQLIDDRLPEHSPAQRWLAAVVIFVLAVCLRLPSCNESFWLDELHSAWSIWGTLAEVMPRATAGNQTPVYFWLLWFWKQVAGDTEWALRLPSVIASSLAAGMVTVGIAKHRGSLFAGCIAGLVISIESNSIFYGTELRPFAFAMLFGASACYLATSDALSQKHKLVGLMATVIMSGLFQPTSIGVLGWFVVAQLLWWMQHSDNTAKRLRSVPSSLMALGVVAVIASAILFAWLAGGVLHEAWQHRQQWQSMGRTDSLWQLWSVWPWLSLGIVPISLVFLSRIKRNAPKEINQSLSWWCLGLIAVGSTFLFWSTSATGIAPVFHRRYFIACLPILAWTAGDAIAHFLSKVTPKVAHRSAMVAFPPPARSLINRAQTLTLRNLLIYLLASTPLLLLLHHQNTVRKLLALPNPVVSRGEAWRELVAHLNQQPMASELVFLNPGLIESSRLLDATDAPKAAYAQWYLTNPLQGPYRLPNIIAFDSSRSEPVTLPVVIRGNRIVAENWLNRPIAANLRENATIRSFGGVQLIEKRSPELPNP